MIAAHPTTGEALRYQAAAGFKSAIALDGPAPDGSCLRLDGTVTTLHEVLDASRPTILNFGSCT